MENPMAQQTWGFLQIFQTNIDPDNLIKILPQIKSQSCQIKNKLNDL